MTVVRVSAKQAGILYRAITSPAGEVMVWPSEKRSAQRLVRRGLLTDRFPTMSGYHYVLTERARTCELMIV